MKKKRFKLNKIIIAVMIIALFAVIITNLIFVSNVTNRQADEVGRVQLDAIRSELSSSLQESETSLQGVAADVERIIESDGVGDVLSEYVAKRKNEFYDATAGNTFNVYAAGTDWDIIPDFDKPDNYRSIDRPWYIGAQKTPGIPFVTDPYIDSMTGDTCYTMAIMLDDKDTVVAMDFTLTKLNESIKRMTDNTTNKALIVTKNGVVLGFNDMSYTGKKLTEAVPEYSESYQNLKVSGNKKFETTINGITYMTFGSVASDRWYMLLFIEEKTLYGNGYKQMGTNIALILILSAISIILYSRLRKQSKAQSEVLEKQNEFFKSLHDDLNNPVKSILSLTSYDESDEGYLDSQEKLARIKEAGLRLQTTVKDMNVYSSMAGEKSAKGSTNDVLDSGKKISRSIKKSRNLMAVMLFTISIIVAVFGSFLSFLLIYLLTLGESVSQSSYLDIWFVNQRAIINTVGKELEVESDVLKDHDRTVKWLDDMVRGNTTISAIYVGNTEWDKPVKMNNGWEPDADFRLDSRDWYKETMKLEGDLNISAPYYDAQTGQCCITMSKMLFDKNGQFLCVIGADYYMDSIFNASSGGFTSYEYSFMVDQQGNIINHPNKEYRMSENNMVSLSDTCYNKIYERLNEDHEIGIISKDYTGHLAYITNMKMKTSPFYLVSVTDLQDNAYFMIFFITAFLVIALIATAIFSLVLTNRIIKWQNQSNEELSEAVEDARAAGKAKSDFLARMSHEIRTPINAVIGMDEMILRETDDPDIREYAANIDSAGKTLLNLINGILDFSKIEDGKMEIIPVKYEILDVIDDLVNMISEKATEKGLDLSLEIDPKLPKSLFGDDIRIKQIVTNLLTNAVKYTEEGTVVLKCTGYYADEENYMLYFGVYDTGIGIKEEDTKRLFESFRRIDETRNRNIEGTGLGISIVQALLDMMGSELKVESVYGEGSQFSFRLKQQVIEKAEIGNYNRHREASLIKEGHRKVIQSKNADILVVDDNEMNLKVVKGLLKRTGIVPDLCDSGAKCIESVKAKHYDIIFLDHMMPEMDGVVTLKKMKKEKLLPPDTTVIVLTANAIVGAKEEYLKEGFEDYLSKPIESEKLESLLAKYLPDNKIDYAETTDLRALQAKNKKAQRKKWEEQDLPERKEEGALSEFVVKLKEKNFDTESGLKYVVGDEGFYKELLLDFANSSSEKKKSIEASYDSMNVENYRIFVHALKSTSRTIGANELSVLALDQEDAAKKNDEAAIKKGYEALMSAYDKAVADIREVLGEGEKEIKTELKVADKDYLKDMLGKAIAFFDNFEEDGASKIIAELCDYVYDGKPLSEVLSECKNKMENFDLKGAADIAKKILEDIA